MKILIDKYSNIISERHPVKDGFMSVAIKNDTWLLIETGNGYIKKEELLKILKLIEN